MPKALSIALLAAGVMLLIFGISASESFSSEISRFFTGTPTDKAMWLTLGGVTAAIVGAVGLFLPATK